MEYSFLNAADATRGRSDKIFGASGANEFGAPKLAEGGGGRLATALLAPLGLMALTGLLLFLARRSRPRGGFLSMKRAEEGPVPGWTRMRQEAASVAASLRQATAADVAA